jgi:hypothetical protein
MTIISERLRQHLLRQPPSVTTNYKRLSPVDQAVIVRAFTRHAKLCEKSNLSVEMTFITEIIADLHQVETKC